MSNLVPVNPAVKAVPLHLDRLITYVGMDKALKQNLVLSEPFKKGQGTNVFRDGCKI